MHRKVCRRVPKAMNGGHEMDWVRACKESPSSRVMPKSDFSEAGPMNEMVAMGVLAIRLQGLNKTLEWDGANMRFTNIGDDETLRTVIKTASRYTTAIRASTRHGQIR